MALRALIRALLPERMLTAMSAVRARKHSHRLNAEWGVAALSKRLLDELGPRVLDGPFKGLRLPPSTAPEHLGPYLLGTYERELHPVWLSIAPGTVPLIVNVGAKFGYYSAGLARRLDAPAIAYDADPWARARVQETADLNTAPVTVRGQCTRSDLRDLPVGTLVVIDCDGCEEILLRDPVPPGILRSTVIVELHDEVMRGDEVAATLRKSHVVKEVPSVNALAPPSVLNFLEPEQRKLAVEELRPKQRWLICTPR